MDVIARIQEIIDSVGAEHAPDPRLSVFEVWASLERGVLTLEGAISEPVALEALRQQLSTLEEIDGMEDHLRRLPETDDDRRHALVTAAVVPMLAGPTVTETHVSQTVLGHHLLVLRQNRRWLQVRSEDGYLGWVHRGYVHRVGEVAARAWKTGASEEAYLSLGAELTSTNGETIAKLPWGARFLSNGAEGVLPTGVRGRLTGDAIPASLRGVHFPPDGDAVVETALGWAKTPYLWGGITPAGADCSGFVQVVYRMHGIDLPRDSDLQALIGEPVEYEDDFSNVSIGDLLFFAEVPERISHVGISLGGSRIVHSALGNGGVSLNDLRGSAPMERELRRLFVGIRRVLPASPGASIPPARQ